MVALVLLCGCESSEDYARVTREPTAQDVVGQWALFPPPVHEALSLAVDKNEIPTALTLRADESCTISSEFIDVLANCYEAPSLPTSDFLCHWGTVQTGGKWEVQVAGSPEAGEGWVLARMGLFQHVDGRLSLSGRCVSGTGYALYWQAE